MGKWWLYRPGFSGKMDANQHFTWRENKNGKSLSFKPIDRKIVNDIFDRLHVQRRMEFIIQPTLHKYPVFIFRRTIRSERKKRVVINIRGFNKITVANFYFMPLQSKIISAIIGCQYTSIFDIPDFFHQWLVRLTDRHKFTVVSHRG